LRGGFGPCGVGVAKCRSMSELAENEGFYAALISKAEVLAKLSFKVLQGKN
jgi:hypothetical protein